MSFKEISRFFKYYFKDEKKLFIKAFGFIFISSLLGVLYGYLIGLAIDEASVGSFSMAIIILIVYLGAGIADNIIFDRLGKIYIEKMAMNMSEKISYDVYDKVGLLPARAFEEKTSGELINRITQDSGTITGTFKQLLRIVVALWTSLIVFIYVCMNSWFVALEIVIYLILFYLFSKRFLPAIRENEKEISKEKDKVVAEVSETIRGIREIRALGIRKKTNETIRNLVRGIFYRNEKQMINERDYNAVVMSLNNILEVVVFITCIVLISLGKTTFSFFMAITYYIYRFMNTVNYIMEISTSYQKMKVSVERIAEILGNKIYKDDVFGTVDKTDIIGNIEFKNVNFQYSNEEELIFKDLNLKLESGKKIAIVGKSGQGKTSLFNLLLRYFKPNSGVILIDDIPIDDFSEEAFHKNIAIIRQDPFLFNKSIADNLRIIDSNLSLEEIRKACKLAEIDEYIMSLPKKYDTIIGEGGVNLSGGQKQRLAIARALLKKSKIILFDEATSALDNESQAKIKKAIDNLVTNHTIIMVAHRLSTIIDADVIHVVEKGTIVASGNHKKLLANNKTYKSLYQSEM